MDYFEYTDDVEVYPPTDFDVEEFLERERQREQQRLEFELQRIDDQLQDRDRIHQETVEELESKIDWYVERLESLHQQNVGHDGKRERLKDTIKSLYQELRQERQSHWQDRQNLEQERREILRELDELDTEILSDLLS